MKPNKPFFNSSDLPWTPVQGAPPGVYEKILAADDGERNYTRLQKFEKGVTTGKFIHDFWEEVFIISGSFVENDQRYGPGTYCCRPPGIEHGPFYAPEEVIMLEFRNTTAPRSGPNVQKNVMQENVCELSFSISGSLQSICLRRAILAGYTGRNRGLVLKHIEELREIGVPALETVPAFYPVSPCLVQTGSTLEVKGYETSGEAEAVLICHKGQVFVGVGSDHTDRSLEAVSILRAKQVCGKPVSAELWPLDEVLDYWDELELRSWVVEGQTRRLYQEGRLVLLLEPNSLLEQVKKECEDLEGMIVFGGTIPILSSTFVYGPGFAVELYDPRKGSALSCRYMLKFCDGESQDLVF